MGNPIPQGVSFSASVYIVTLITTRGGSGPTQGQRLKQQRQGMQQKQRLSALDAKACKLGELDVSTSQQQTQLATQLAKLSDTVMERAEQRGPQYVLWLAEAHLKYQTLVRDLSTAEGVQDFRLALLRLESLRAFCGEPENDIFAFEEGFFEAKKRL
ncbi:hypothetical protein QBC43DRAFT_289201 [Cladorrhinum sp. PSN259]|nr:hypothetical protein QBC43DRAFT_289201 [Cladorrhinum sp. PSN259]